MIRQAIRFLFIIHNTLKMIWKTSNDSLFIHKYFKFNHLKAMKKERGSNNSLLFGIILFSTFRCCVFRNFIKYWSNCIFFYQNLNLINQVYKDSRYKKILEKSFLSTAIEYVKITSDVEEIGWMAFCSYDNLWSPTFSFDSKLKTIDNSALISTAIESMILKTYLKILCWY